ncbi:hypothetical protein G4O51_12435 [Candidatus Bathyarchaeota archaeon A05DMB-2]|jgi:hypothetical protein|nr:hypothetical protein [Candidatus Bathyarchaeota archaeon A05DMB-2]
MRKEAIELDERFGKEYAGRYVFSEITWAKRNRIIQKYTRYSQQTGQVLTSDYVAIQAETIMASLKEQPQNKPITLEKLLSEEDGVPIELGELFSQIVNKLNSVSLEETAFLSEPSENKSQTKPSQNSASAKSSGGHQTSSLNSQQKQSSNSSSSSTS